MFIQLRAKFREPSLGIRDFEKMLRRQGKVIEALARSYPEHDKTNWRLKGDTEDLAKLFPVFDTNGPSRIGLAVLRLQFQKEQNRSFVAIWDGLKAPRVDCSMACHVGPPEDAHTLKVDLMSEEDAIGPALVISMLTPIVEQFDPLWIQVYPTDYSEQVFPDKPGVAWMLYLPLEITAQQVPEAAALVPMAGRDGRRRGTLVLSVVDEVFDGDNPRHIEAATSIDIRMVDQDLMPCYSDLWPAA